ncbi:MAG: ABC transporter permease [Chloroflexi bacterium]|nr:ABC transporter permease [Chloroflexota bacterium]
MRRFIVRRFFFAILTIIAATAVVFTLSRAAGDPLLLYAKPGGYGFTPEQEAALRAKLGLDKHVVLQYFIWLGQVVRGDLGETILDEKPVSRVVTEKLPATLQLAVIAWIGATVIGIPLGVLSAVRRGTVWDYIGRGFALFGQALPQFWIALVFIMIFAVQLDWLPAGTRGTGMWDFQHALLPSICLGWFALAIYMRLTRSAMLEVLDSEFVKLARVKGVSNMTVLWKHAFRNALLQPLTASALLMSGFIHGSVLVENVFAWPGMGRMAIRAVNDNDFPVLLGVVLMFTGMYVVVNFATDLLYAFIDPRIRYD